MLHMAHLKQSDLGTHFVKFKIWFLKFKNNNNKQYGWKVKSKNSVTTKLKENERLMDAHPAKLKTNT